MTILLYCDEDSQDHALVFALRNRGIDVVTPVEADMLGETDDQQLEYAATQGRVIYSFNVSDFCRLHSEWLAEGRSHAGIVVADQEQFSIGEQMRRLIRLVNALSAAEMQDRLEFLGSWGETDDL
jgi:hypothetical protein